MKILFPTDFSEHAAMALKYAVELSRKMNAELHIVTTFSVQKHSSSFVSFEDKVRQNVTEDLDDFIKSNEPELLESGKIKKIVAHAHPGSYIIGYAEKEGIDLIVMGTKGLSDIANIFIGSVTREVMGKSTLPVLAIPMMKEIKQIGKKIVMAYDGLKITHGERLKILLDISNSYSSKITIFHVSESQEEKIQKHINGLPSDSIEDFIIREGKEPLKEIRIFVEEVNADLLVMVRKEKNFWQKLFLTGHTDEEIMRASIPLLVITDK